MCKRQVLEKSRGCFGDLKFDEYLGTEYHEGKDCIRKNKTLHRELLMSKVFNSGNLDSVFAEDDKLGIDYFRMKKRKYFLEKYNITYYSEN